MPKTSFPMPSQLPMDARWDLVRHAVSPPVGFDASSAIRSRRRPEKGDLTREEIEELVGGVVTVQWRGGARRRRLLEDGERTVGAARRELGLHQGVEEPERLPGAGSDDVDLRQTLLRLCARPSSATPAFLRDSAAT